MNDDRGCPPKDDVGTIRRGFIEVEFSAEIGCTVRTKSGGFSEHVKFIACPLVGGTSGAHHHSLWIILEETFSYYNQSLLKQRVITPRTKSSR